MKYLLRSLAALGILAGAALIALVSVDTWHKAKAQLGPPNQVLCNQLIIQAASTTSLATIVTGTSGKVVFICGWHVTNNIATAATFTLSSGTGTNCATTNTNITPAFSVTSSAPSTDHVEFASLSLAAGNNLCVISSATTLQIGIWVSQQ